MWSKALCANVDISYCTVADQHITPCTSTTMYTETFISLTDRDYLLDVHVQFSMQYKIPLNNIVSPFLCDLHQKPSFLRKIRRRSDVLQKSETKICKCNETLSFSFSSDNRSGTQTRSSPSWPFENILSK